MLRPPSYAAAAIQNGKKDMVQQLETKEQENGMTQGHKAVRIKKKDPKKRLPKRGL
jgi:hypothetical protein